ncbi:MAG: alginate export family protein, partial [Myxococcales bacterium]|nr:alginate export family protein [Myxococcales bacterium]
MSRLSLLARSTMAAALLAVPAVASAQDPQPPQAAPGPLTVDGSFWTRFELRDNYAGAGVSQGRFQEGDATFYRARLGLWTTPTKFRGDQQVQARFVLQAAGVQGVQPGTINDPAVGAHEAFLRWQGAMHRLDVGRFEMVYGDHAIIGNLGWHQMARSFDGARVRLAKDPKGAWVDVFATLARPDAVPGEKHPLHDELLEGDDWFTGIYSDIGPLLAQDLTLELYGLFQVQVGSDDDTGGEDRDGAVLATVGTRVVKSFGKTRVRFEGTGQFGKDLAQNDAKAYQADLEVKQTLSDALWVAVGGVYASGDDPTTEENEGFNHLYSTAHKFLGLMDVIGTRTNVTSGNLQAAFKVQPTTTLKLDAHLFLRNEVPDDVDSYAGTELNLQVIQGIGGGLGVRGLYGLFLPGKDLYPTEAPLHYV